MVRKVGRTGFLGLAICAIVLPVGSAAAEFHAYPPAVTEFHSSVEHATLDGKQVGTDLLTVNAGAVSCSAITYSGTQSAKTTSTMTLTPAYTGCNAFGFAEVPIDVNGCQFVFHAAATNTVDLSCPGNPIEVTGPNCTSTIGSQTGLKSVTYNTEGSTPKRDLKVKLSLSGLKYTQHGKGGTPCTGGTFTNGTYSGEATVTGTDTAGSQTDLWVATSATDHSILDGAQPIETKDFPTFNIGSFACSSITYSGTLTTSTATKIFLTPSYGGCSWFYGGVSVHVNGCQWVFESSGFGKSAGISCPGKPMEVTFSTICVVTIDSQTGLKEVSYDNHGSGSQQDIAVTLNLTGIKYTQDSKSFPGCTQGTFSNGTYKGAATITGTDTAGTQVAFWFA